MGTIAVGAIVGLGLSMVRDVEISPGATPGVGSFWFCSSIVRATACRAEGCGCESRQDRHFAV